MFDLSKEHDHNCQHSFVTRVKNISSFLELNLLSVLAYNKINVDYNHTSNCIRDWHQDSQLVKTNEKKNKHGG
jgi:hypothetical protein